MSDDKELHEQVVGSALRLVMENTDLANEIVEAAANMMDPPKSKHQVIRQRKIAVTTALLLLGRQYVYVYNETNESRSRTNG